MAEDPTVGGKNTAETPRPELNFEPGEICMHWASPYQPVNLTGKAEASLKDICAQTARRDLAARRWECEDAWAQRLFKRGYQYLLPRRGGGWVALGFSGGGYWGNRNKKFWGNETNIYSTINELITASLTRDIPDVKFEARCSQSDADITAKDGSQRYAKIFSSQNDLCAVQTQIADYMGTDGRVILITEHIIDAQSYGRAPLVEAEPDVVPETEEQLNHPLIFIVRHGEVDKNANGELRGRSEDPLNALGRREAEKVSAFLSDKGINRIICSPIARSVETAESISQHLSVPMDVDDRLESFDLGDLTSKDASENADEIKAIFSGKEAAPGGEEVEEFDQRVASGLLDVLRSPGLPAAIVCHDSVISSVAKFINPDIPYGIINVPPGGVAVIEGKEDGTYEMRPIFPMSTGTISAGIKRGVPRGQEVVEVCGKLEAKVPINTQTINQMGFVNVSREFDVSFLKAMFPKQADKIKPGGSGIAEIELDRIARINTALALEASYITGDSQINDVTLHRIWLRPCEFMKEQDPALRKELFDSFPDGAKVYMAGDEYLCAVNECLDDHITLIQALPGTGQNRKSLCSSIMPIQRRLNTWMDILDAFVTRVIPQRYAATEVFDTDAIAQQTSGPGPYIPFTLNSIPPGRNVQDAIWVEQTPTPQPFLLQLVLYFIEQLPQLIAHAVPSLFGSNSNTDMPQISGVGMALQRDQALAAQATPWHAIKMGTCSYYRQAVQLAARCRNQPIHETDRNGEAVDIELDDLKGNVMCYPLEDSNIPISYSQKKAEWQKILADSVNPMVAKLLTKAANIRAWIEANGLEEFRSSEADAYEKQMGELDVLLASGPTPNPQVQQIQQAFESLKAQAGAKLMQNIPLQPEEEQQMTQLEQAAKTLPQLVSTVPVKDTDDHISEAEACLDFINDARGRKLANGTEDEKEAFLNLNIHLQEHQAKIKPPEPQVKPASVTMNLKDMPPDAAAKELERRGDVPTQGSDVVNTREFAATIAKSAHVQGPQVPTPVVPAPQQQ